MGLRSVNQANHYVNWKNPVGAVHQQLAVADTAVALPKVGPWTTAVWLQVTDNTVRYTVDGATDPTSTLGFQATAGTTIYLSPEQANAIRFIQESAAAVVEFMQVSW